MALLGVAIYRLGPLIHGEYVQLSNSTKLLPIPSGHPHGTTGAPINARFGQW